MKDSANGNEVVKSPLAVSFMAVVDCCGINVLTINPAGRVKTNDDVGVGVGVYVGVTVGVGENEGVGVGLG